MGIRIGICNFALVRRPLCCLYHEDFELTKAGKSKCLDSEAGVSRDW